MDCFVGSEGEWDLCSSILSLENQQLDFTSIPDAWFCSLDSFTANFNFGANSCDGNDQFSNCIAAAADDHHHHNHIMSISGGAIQDQKEMESIFLQEISGFCGEDHRFVNMDYIQTHQGDDDANNNPANALHYKRKSTLLAHDDDHIPTKKIRTSTNVEKTRKAATQSNGKMRKQKLSSRRRKCEEEEENGVCDMNSCSSTDNSSEDNDNASLQTGAVNLEGDVSPSKANTRATRGSATDPQSLYARKRRERINERLKLLQKLVPNGTKVDISTMLEEAVNYVKFLQLQIKLLSSDELWMYAPIAYNGMDIGVQHKLSSIL